VAASMPAGIVNFTFTCLFLGTASYVGTFVAQYYGAGENYKIGKSLWQGIYIALFGSAVIFMIGFAAEPIFRFVGHDPEVQRLEVIYFKILCFGSFGPITSSVFSGFYSGRGKNWPVMWISIISAGVNIVLDYVFIFGHFGFPEMGITGAAIATVIAGFTPIVIYGVLVFGREHNVNFGTLSGYRFDGDLFRRILKFGFPSGVHMFIEIAGFSGFLLIVGRLGTTELAATNIALNINSIAFMPMIGFGIAISMLTGQNIGRGSVNIAERVIWSGFQLCFVYMTLIALTYFFLPEIYIFPFAAKADPGSFVLIREFTITLLKFVAIYSIFDTLNLVFASAIKGAGDTRFVMMMGFFLSLLLLVTPSYVAVVVMGRGLYTAWGIASVYISLLGFSYLFRFLTGKWKTMKVIEHVAVLPSSCPDVPYLDL
ncbi:MAG: MATE family efflux transporter, partial [Spirochaetae bacterium HGW-Spirochaetae-5]